MLLAGVKMSSNKGLRVLVIDADPHELYRACEIVAGLGIEDMLCASTFEDAMCCLDDAPSLIITDATAIPRSKHDPSPVPGDKLLQEVKAKARGAIVIGQIVGMSGDNMVSALLSGADDVVEKRETPSRLLDKMPMWLSVARKSLVVEALTVGVCRMI